MTDNRAVRPVRNGGNPNHTGTALKPDRFL
nr:MAG TPA: hypothetical protein [Caudoviricetes sp.]